MEPLFQYMILFGMFVATAELAVLVKTGQGWKISSVHWSSRSAEQVLINFDRF